MKDTSCNKSIIVKLALQQMPQIICDTLIDDMDFRKEYNITTDAIISINKIGVHFKRSEFYNAIRDVFSGIMAKEVSDTSGEKWIIKNSSDKNKLPQIELSGNKQYFISLNLTGFFHDKNIRRNYLDNIVCKFNLSSMVREKWWRILSERTFQDDEVDDFNNEIQDTPIKRSQTIRDEILSGNCRISTLVPISRKYFERLVGIFDGSDTVHEYASGVSRQLFKQLSLWKSYDGFMFSLFLSAHSSITDEIRIDKLNNEKILKAFKYLEENGDRLSQIGAIEVGLRVISEIPEIETIVISLIKQIYEDNVDDPNSEFNLLSALFMLVDGEISRARLFSKEPPFYRRLVSLSQAALIHRQIINSGIDIHSFSEWAFNSRAKQFYMQSLIDMRREPLWNPEYASAAQLKAEFLGRIIVAANKYEQNIKNRKISEMISKIVLLNQSSIGTFMISGPLEGISTFKDILSDEISEMIKAKLNKDMLDPTSFIALINCSQIFCIDSELAELAAKSIKISDYKFINIKDRSQLLYTLNGLATVAAVSRSCILADELRVLVRRYRRDAKYALSIDEVVGTCIVAASSRKDLSEWRNFVGDCFTELAFSDLVDSDGQVLYSWLRYLCHIVPELWVSCGRADAALLAYNAKSC